MVTVEGRRCDAPERVPFEGVLSVWPKRAQVVVGMTMLDYWFRVESPYIHVGKENLDGQNGLIHIFIPSSI